MIPDADASSSLRTARVVRLVVGLLVALAASFGAVLQPSSAAAAGSALGAIAADAVPEEAAVVPVADAVVVRRSARRVARRLRALWFRGVARPAAWTRVAWPLVLRPTAGVPPGRAPPLG